MATAPVNLYISAALDLELEREILGRAAAEIPVTLGWRIFQSPAHGEPVNLEAVVRADVHLLLLGSDIRAPIGLEWRTARRAGKIPVLFLKNDALRTPAGQDFRRYVAQEQEWRTYQDIPGLHRQALGLLCEVLIGRAIDFNLQPQEFERLKEWRKELDAAGKQDIDDTRAGAGDSGVILSPEQAASAGGILLQPPSQKEGNR